jgi:hypothetical protein
VVDTAAKTVILVVLQLLLVPIITTSGHTACTTAAISGTVTRNLASTIVLTSGTQSPTVCSGTAITMVYILAEAQLMLQ